MHLLSVFSLRNRALIALITIVVAVFGTISLTSLKQELIPSISFPQLVVVTAYPGASPEVVNEDVSTPIETAMQGVPGLEGTTATSRTNVSTISASFEFGTDLATAEQKVTQAINRIKSILPADIDPRVITGSIDDLPVIQIAVTSDLDIRDLSAALEGSTLTDIEGLEGVREAQLLGTVGQRLVISPNPASLAAAGASMADISDAIDENGLLLPAGSITEDGRTLSVQAGSRIQSVEAVGGLPLSGVVTDAGGVVTIADVATVKITDNPITSISRVNGEPSLTVAVTKTPAGNTVAVSEAVLEAIPGLEDSLGDNTKFTVVFDQAPFIQQSIEALATEGVLGLLFAVIVILVFLMSVRSTLVTAISIPASVFITFIGMQAAGYTLNIITLGALTISVGRVVDDSIVVIENIKRHIGLGKDKLEAITTGVREVAVAVTSATVTTVAVFLPLALVGDITGELFRPFALTVTIALAASLFVSLTIVPVLAYWFLGNKPLAGAEASSAVARAIPARLGRLFARGPVPVRTNGADAAAPAHSEAQPQPQHVTVAAASAPRTAEAHPAVSESHATVAEPRTADTASSAEYVDTETSGIPTMGPDGVMMTRRQRREAERVAAGLPARQEAPNVEPSTLATATPSADSVTADFAKAEAVPAEAAEAAAASPVVSEAGLAAEQHTEQAADLRTEVDELDTPTRLQSWYLPVIHYTLKRPALTMVAALLVLAATLAMVPSMKTNFIGDSGQNTLTVSQTLPLGTSLEAQDAAANTVEDALLGIDGIETVQLSLGSSNGLAAAFGGGGGINYSVTTDTDVDQEALQAEVRDVLAELGDVGEVSLAAAGSGFASTDISVNITANGQQDLNEAADAVLTAVRDLDITAEASSNLSVSQPYIAVEVDRAKAAELGLSEIAVGGLVSGSMLPRAEGTVVIDEKTMSIYIDRGTAPATIKELQNFVIPSAAGPVPLSQLATVAEVDGPASITTVRGVRSATVSVTPNGDDVGTASAEVQAAVDEVKLPGGAKAELGGVTAQQGDAFEQLGLALLIAILIVYVVMVATFKSLRQPLLLLVSVPFAATGAIALQVISGIPLGVPSLIGVLMLIGVVVTNAIVLIDLVNQYRVRGMRVMDAIVHGAARRLRPILMTALATIFALLPLGLGVTGHGGFISQPLAVVVIGGLVSSTVLTLVVLPALYYLVEGAKERREDRHTAEADAVAPTEAGAELRA